MVKNQKNCPMVVFDSSKWPSGCTERNAKNLSSLWNTISEKIQNNRQKWPKIAKLCNFGGYSVFFQKWYLTKRQGFLRCVQCIKTFILSYQKQLFEKIYNFHYKGGPLWFRMVKKLTTPLKLVKNWKQKHFWDQDVKWNKKTDGTEHFIGPFKIRISLAELDPVP